MQSQRQKNVLADSINSFPPGRDLAAELRRAECINKQQEAKIESLQTQLSQAQEELKNISLQNELFNKQELKCYYAILNGHLFGPEGSLAALNKFAEKIKFVLTYGGEAELKDVSEPAIRSFLDKAATELADPAGDPKLIEALSKQAKTLTLTLALIELSRSCEIRSGTITPPVTQLKPVSSVHIRAQVLLDHIWKTKKTLYYSDCLKVLQGADAIGSLGNNRYSGIDYKPAMVYRAMRRAAWCDRGVVYEEKPSKLRLLRDDERPQVGVQVQFGRKIGTC